MSPAVGIIPLVIVPLSFLFVLLIILVTKAPKAGAWVIGGLILLAPLVLWRCAAAGMLAHGEAVPLVIVPGSFLFVLLIILLAKVPKVGAGLVIAIVIMVLVGLLLMPVVSYRRASYVSPSVEMSQWKEVVTEQGVERIQVWENTSNEPTLGSAGLARLHQASPTPPMPPAPPSPIWSEAVETEFEADLYPSQLAAVRALGLRMDKTIRELTKDADAPAQIVLFQESRDPGLLAGLKNAIQQALPQLSCAIEAETRNIRPNEIGVELHFNNQDMQPAPWARSSETKVASGRIEVRVFTTRGQVSPQRGYVEKPWLDNFATFASTRPEQAFIIARSLGTCTSESEANQQALEDARARLTEAISQRGPWMSDKLPKPQITATDVLQGGFIVDRFAQSFEGTVGKIWRQALLIDVSGPKLAQLAGQKAREFRQAKDTWARMGFSAVGVLVLIGAIYFFLNMATMGYYEWSLRIACVVLAIVGVLSILMVVR